MDIVESIKSVLSPPHKAGYPFILGGVVVAVLGLIIWHPLAWLGLLFTLFCLYFFRDPERVLPPVSDVFVAPADGLVVSIEHAVPPAELGLGPGPAPARSDLPLGAGRACEPHADYRDHRQDRLPSRQVPQRRG